MTTRVGSTGAPEIAAGMLLLAAIGGGVWWVSQPDTVVAPAEATTEMEAPAFPPIDLPAGMLESWAAEQALLEDPPGPEATTLLQLWSVANFVGATASLGLFDGDPQVAAAEYNEGVRRYLAGREVSAYRVLSWAAHSRFMDGLAALDTVEGSGPVAGRMTALRSSALQAHYEACGDFFAQAVRSGLVSATGELLVRPELLTIIFRYRWFQAARTHRPMQELMPGSEYQIFLRWRMERALDVPTDVRLEYVDRFFREFPQFDLYTAEHARSVILFEASAGRVMSEN